MVSIHFRYMLKRHVMPQADHYGSFHQIYTFNSSICKKMSTAFLSTCRMARRYHKYILYVDFVLHSRSKVNCGKKQIIIRIRKFNPKVSISHAISSNISIYSIHKKKTIRYIHLYYLFLPNIIQDTYIPGCSGTGWPGLR